MLDLRTVDTFKPTERSLSSAGSYWEGSENSIKIWASCLSPSKSQEDHHPKVVVVKVGHFI